jgi:hypothetical protein
MAGGSLPWSQDPATGTYPEPGDSSPHPPPYFPEIHSNIIFPSTARSSELAVTFRLSDENFTCISHLC